MKVKVRQRNQEKIGVGCLVISERAKQLVNQALNNNRLSYGPFHRKLEEMFSKEHFVKYAIFTNSGTSALQVALASLKNKYNWQEGDEVIIPAVTFVATANIVISLGMKPVFVDVKMDTYNIDPDLIEKSITDRVRCIIPVHLLGLPADMDPIMKIAKRNNLKIIEDSCETMFVNYKNQNVGSFGDIACFSTYVAHFLVTGVGGFAITNDPDLYTSMKSLINHGRDSIYLSIDDNKDINNPLQSEVIAKRFKFNQIGYSYRCTELEAAIGIAQLEDKDFNIRKRRENALYLTENLKDLSQYLQLPCIPADREHAFMLYGVVLKKGSKKEFVNYLEKNLIETRDLLPLVNQPIYKRLYGEDLEERFPVAKYLNNHAFYIGCHQYLTKDDLDYIIRIFHDYF